MSRLNFFFFLRFANEKFSGKPYLELDPKLETPHCKSRTQFLMLTRYVASNIPPLPHHAVSFIYKK
jgi:hypothetical protein